MMFLVLEMKEVINNVIILNGANIIVIQLQNVFNFSALGEDLIQIMAN